jgi:hypothetical protein
VDLIDLDELELVDGDELETVKRLVSALFGDFDPHIEIEGAYFGERRYPHTVYQSASNRFLVAICIPKHQADDPMARIMHLSHELVHCLSPNGYPPAATILEEGLAEHSKIYLSQAIFQDYYPNYDFRDMLVGSYLAAFNEIEELVRYEGLEGMREGIRRIRATTELPFCRITEDHLAVEFLHTAKALLRNLSLPFKG